MEFPALSELIEEAKQHIERCIHQGNFYYYDESPDDGENFYTIEMLYMLEYDHEQCQEYWDMCSKYEKQINHNGR